MFFTIFFISVLREPDLRRPEEQPPLHGGVAFALHLLCRVARRDLRPFKLAGETFASRLLLGTAGYPTQRIMVDAVTASGCEIVTASMLGDNYPQALAGLDKIKALGGENPSHFYLRAIILDKQNVLPPALEYYQRFLAASNGKFHRSYCRKASTVNFERTSREVRALKSLTEPPRRKVEVWILRSKVNWTVR